MMVPGAVASGNPRSAMASAAAARCSGLSASRAASAAARRSPFDSVAGISDIKYQTCGQTYQRTKYRAMAAYDGSVELGSKQNRQQAKNKSAKPRWPLERSIPEFPTKVGGHHVTKSTDLARDSSLKDR